MNLRTISIIILFALLFGGVGYYIWRDIASINKPVVQNPADNNAKSIDITSIDEKGTTTGGVTIKRLPSNNSISLPPVPSLNRSITFPDSIPAEIRDKVRAKILALEAELKKDSSIYDSWIDLGMQRKFIDDFEGAKEAWEYAAALRPTGYVPPYNLGSLYGYYLHDNKKAESNYLKAISLGPDQIYMWRDLYSFYRDVLKNDVLAKKALQDGIAKNPNTSQDLKYLLDNYNR